MDGPGDWFDSEEYQAVSEGRNAPRHMRDGFVGQRMVVWPQSVVDKAINGHMPMNLMVSDVGYFPDAAGHFIERPEGCPQCILILCVRGSGWVTVNRRRYRITPGHLATILSGQPHSYGSEAGWTIYWLHAAGVGTRYFTAMIDRRGLLPVMELPNYLKIIPLFDEIMRELSLGYSSTHALVAMMALGHLLANINAQGRSIATSQSAEQRVRAAVGSLRANWRDSVSVPELARTCNLSTSHFSSIFRELTGTSPLDFCRHLKVQRAAEMMDHTDWPLKRISMEAGFNDPLYFSRVFHRIYKMSPTAYRQRTKG